MKRLLIISVICLCQLARAQYTNSTYSKAGISNQFNGLGAFTNKSTLTITGQTNVFNVLWDTASLASGKPYLVIDMGRFPTNFFNGVRFDYTTNFAVVRWTPGSGSGSLSTNWLCFTNGLLGRVTGTTNVP